MAGVEPAWILLRPGLSRMRMPVSPHDDRCFQQESNLHASRHNILSIACLPFPTMEACEFDNAVSHSAPGAVQPIGSSDSRVLPRQVLDIQRPGWESNPRQSALQAPAYPFGFLVWTPIDKLAVYSLFYNPSK